MKIKYLLLASIAGAIIALDQLTKLYIHTRFHLGQSVTIIPDFFSLTYVRNFGAAFGILSSAPDHFREPFFMLIPLFALVIVIFILRSTHDKLISQIVALSLIFGGAIGNYLDRIRFGYVIDFLDAHYKDYYHWPAFNVADSAIVMGVCLMVLHMTLSKQVQEGEGGKNLNAPRASDSSSSGASS